jgi:NTE family protein
MSNKSEFASIALLLQGGGALGAYQGGVYEALAESQIVPDWVGGISIGAINGAIIAGNKPAERVEKLRGFWDLLTSNPPWYQSWPLNPLVTTGDGAVRSFWNRVSAAMTVTLGVPGFFGPHVLPWLAARGSPSATSMYDTKELGQTLHRFIDFDLLNSGVTRFTTSAVNVTSGNYTRFDTLSQEIGPSHIMASGALPPGLPAIEIEGEHYWDGGLISNTPLDWVLHQATSQNTLIFQVDLWSSEGEFPKDILEVATRGKEIQYSSRTRAITRQFKEIHRNRHLFASLYDKLPPELKESKEARQLSSDCGASLYNIVHLIYRARQYEDYSKDFEFSRQSMEEHWKAGYEDTQHSLEHKEVLKLPACAEGVTTYDLTRRVA